MKTASEQQQQPTAIKDAKVLMVGAGGIGCALPKTLALSGFQDIHNVTVHVKGRTECYPKPAQRTYPVCTITNTPSKFIHCIVWAKGLHFAKLFLVIRIKSTISMCAQVMQALQNLLMMCLSVGLVKILRGEFLHNIETALKIEETWKNRTRPKPIYATVVRNQRNEVGDDVDEDII